MKIVPDHSNEMPGNKQRIVDLNFFAIGGSLENFGEMSRGIAFRFCGADPYR